MCIYIVFEGPTKHNYWYPFMSEPECDILMFFGQLADEARRLEQDRPPTPKARKQENQHIAGA